MSSNLTRQFASIHEPARRRNLRQLLLATSRIVSRHVVEELNAHGYPHLRATHTTLLSNMDLAGCSVTQAADRAGITKQAMGRLAVELADAGYVVMTSDPEDGRVRRIELTAEGRTLMKESFAVMSRLEKRYERELGGGETLAALASALGAFVERFERDREIEP